MRGGWRAACVYACTQYVSEGEVSHSVCAAVAALTAKFDEYMTAHFPELPEGISRQ